MRRRSRRRRRDRPAGLAGRSCYCPQVSGTPVALAALVLTVALAAGCSDGEAKIPITTRSEQARMLFVEGRDLFETLRVAEANARVRQAV